MLLLKVLFLFLFLEPESAGGDKEALQKEVNIQSRIEHRTSNPALHSPAYNLELERFYSDIENAELELGQQYGEVFAQELCNSLRAAAKSPDFLFEVPLRPKTKSKEISVTESIKTALNTKPYPKSRLDSASRIVNYVYTHYTYGDRDRVGLQGFYPATMEEIGKQINSNSLAGLCGDLSHFTALIISTLLPEWGTPVKLNSEPGDGQGLAHTFVGVADNNGVIYMVLDPTINGIWMDNQTGAPLSLDELRRFLHSLELTGRVAKFTSNVFSGHRKVLQEGRFLYSLDFHSAQSMSAEEAPGLPGSYIVSGDLVTDDDPEDWGFKSLFAPIWRKKGYPGSTWANTVLEINSALCESKRIAQLINQKYNIEVSISDNNSPAFTLK